jgi:uncharacterized membrane protein
LLFRFFSFTLSVLNHVSKDRIIFRKHPPRKYIAGLRVGQSIAGSHVMNSQVMTTLALSLLISAALGSGMMAGLFCAFSNFVMRALSRLPPTRAISAMQSINEVIVRPAFLIVFLGTGVACALAFGLGWQHLSKDTLAYVTAGGAVYALGSIAVTIAFNVPLNNRLAAVDPESKEGVKMWQVYLTKWTRWNHVRSIATVVSTVLLLLALLHAKGSA